MKFLLHPSILDDNFVVFSKTLLFSVRCVCVAPVWNMWACFLYVFCSNRRAVNANVGSYSLDIVVNLCNSPRRALKIAILKIGNKVYSDGLPEGGSIQAGIL